MAATDEQDTDRYRRLLADIRAEFPRFRLVNKRDSRFQRAIGATLVVVTFGRMRSYLSSYQTTIGATVYVTDDWDERPADDRYATMRHERVHLRQFRRYTLVGMALLYIFVPLPAGLAWFRARFEKQAYRESIAAAIELYGVAHVLAPEFRRHIEAQFTGPAYGWMWPFGAAIRRWYDATVAELASDGALAR